jgi:uncharacterized protein YdiU (UPF0061 family)
VFWDGKAVASLLFFPGRKGYGMRMSDSLSDAAGPGRYGWHWDHSYAGLPAIFYRDWQPEPVAQPRLILWNAALAASLGLDADALAQPENALCFAGNSLPEGVRPLVQAYAGHQFGNFTILGDGRAILLGEHLTPRGSRVDIQLKGAGPTPFSRGGDGRAALGPMLREYVISEAMAALGIPTTRSLAVVATGEWVYRKEALPGAVLTRVAASHLRVGTLEWAAAQGDRGALEAMVGYALRRHYPERLEVECPALALLEAVGESQAALVARWMHVGFVHGVMNTDNVALSGETIDYGPCAFLDRYDPATTFSSIDRRGRYAFGNQPWIAQWNLARLAETLLPLLHSVESKALEMATGVIEGFAGRFQSEWLRGMRAKLGLFEEESEDERLIKALLDWMAQTKADYTNTFGALSSEGALSRAPWEGAVFEEWHARWKARLARQPQTPAEAVSEMMRHNPVVIPRNHQVEEALGAAVGGELGPLRGLLAVLAKPYDRSAPVSAGFCEPAPADAPPYRTFCGT